MRYILFNLAVGAALIYLFNGGQLPAMDWKAGIAQLKAEVTQKEMAPAPVGNQLAAAGQSHGRDVIEPPKPAPKPKPQPKTTPKPSTGSTKTKAAPQLPPMPQARQVAKRPEPKPAPKGVQAAAEMSVPPVPPVPPAVAQRRAEVLGEAAPTPAPAPKRVRLEPGTTMMSAAERKRELDALAEEMEMLYIQKIGG